MANKPNHDPFIMTRKRREYTQNGQTPKISVDRATYDSLQRVAVESGLSLSEITRQAVAFAMERLEWCDEV